MKCVQLLLVFAFIFPIFINALICEYGTKVFHSNNSNLSLSTFELHQNHHCEAACVYFKCFVDVDHFMEGAGCYEDFDNNCIYMKTETKNHIIKNLTKSDSEYYDNTTMIVTCRSDKCARDAFKKYIDDNGEKHFKVFGHMNETNLLNHDNEKIDGNIIIQFVLTAARSIETWTGIPYKWIVAYFISMIFGIIQVVISCFAQPINQNGNEMPN